MKFLIFTSLLIVSTMTFAKDTRKAKAKSPKTEVTPAPTVVATAAPETGITVESVKGKVCPMVNGKEDCTATEAKDKAMELMKKFKK
ncbi:MAG: hypothetical protein ACOYL6_17695 [Bacteriovoracaceae bacterium]